MAEPEGRGDVELASAAAAGDRDSFAVLYTRHRDLVFCVAVGIMGDREAALDVTQDVFCKLMGVLGRYDGRAAFTTWLHRVAVNACHDVLRRRAAVVSEDPYATAGRPDAGVEADIAAALDVRVALAQVPLEQRSVLVLVDMVGFAYEEAADVLDVPVGTVKSRLARGRLRVADLLSGRESGAGNRAGGPPRPSHGGHGRG